MFNLAAYWNVACTVILTVYGQLIIKYRIGEFGSLPSPTLEKITFLFKVILDPWVFSGFISAFLASFFWMAAMTKLDISSAYPIVVGGLALITSLFAIIFLGESLTFPKVIGLFLIISGVIIIGRAS